MVDSERQLFMACSLRVDDTS